MEMSSLVRCNVFLAFAHALFWLTQLFSILSSSTCQCFYVFFPMRFTIPYLPWCQERSFLEEVLQMLLLFLFC